MNNTKDVFPESISTLFSYSKMNVCVCVFKLCPPPVQIHNDPEGQKPHGGREQEMCRSAYEVWRHKERVAAGKD